MGTAVPLKFCIAIMGKAGAGKDTLADKIEEVFGRKDVYVRDFKFSKCLKDVAAHIFGWDLYRMDEQEYKEEWFPEAFSFHIGESHKYLRSRREVLQFLGTDVFRKMDPHVWINAAFREAQITRSNFAPDVFLSTDCRFPNEQEAIKKNFEQSLFIKLHRGTKPKTSGPEHSSEDIDALTCDMEFWIEDGDMKRFDLIADLVARAYKKMTEEGAANG